MMNIYATYAFALTLAYTSASLFVPCTSTHMGDNSNTKSLTKSAETVLVGVRGPLVNDDAKTFSEAWKSAFNALHTNYSVHTIVVTQDPQKTGLSTKTNTRGLLRTTSTLSTHVGLQLDLQCHCHHCNYQDALLSTFMLRMFEVDLCESLRNSSKAVFTNVSECIVSFQSNDKSSLRVMLRSGALDEGETVETEEQVLTSGPAIQRAQNIEIILMGSPGLMNDDESVFMNECIKLSYNSLHDANDIDLQQVALESQVHHHLIEKSLQRDNIGYTDIWFYVSGRCRMCNPSDLDPSFLPPLSLVASHSGVNPIVLHRGFEMTLCGALRAGPYDYFHAIGDCIVSFTATPPVFITPLE